MSVKDILTDYVLESGVADIIIEYKKQMEKIKCCSYCKSTKHNICNTCSKNKYRPVCKNCCILNFI